MATIKDVARAAGVSASTVSHVVNGTRFVAPDTARQVQDAILRLGYARNDIARALKRSRTRTLGMIVPSSSNPFFAQVIHGLETAAFERGYSLILCNSDDELDRQVRCFDALRSRRIDGLAILSPDPGPDFLEAVAAAEPELPRLLLDTAPRAGACVVADDSFAGGRLAAALFAERGFRRVACITGPAGHPQSRARRAGFAAGLAQAGLPVEPDLVREADLTMPGGYAAAASLLDGPPPEAIFAFNDLMAVGALRAAQERGLTVPDDLSVLGYDDIELAAYVTPPLSTVRQAAAALGERAAALLIDHLETNQPLPDRLLLAPALVLRGSVGRPPRRIP
ncbi:LacI family DNA-binding transcriptional regulator [Azospirillum sp. ST 5-10]|uniref:LacI family DNA-binding transcriptional regulator n=1 Tax=unclassified Azospirillum TaxID=2630922 RepID=UPI003F4A7B30